MNAEVQDASGKLFHYFAIVGLNADEGLKPLKVKQSSSHGEKVLLPPLQRSYQPHILGHYPDAVPTVPFDESSTLLLSLPRGLQLRTQKHLLKPHFHPFLVTREDGSNYYGFVFTFYEEVNSQSICTALYSLQATYLTDVSYAQSSVTIEPDDDPKNTHSLPRQIRLGDTESSSAKNFYDITKDKLFVGKCIVLLGAHPFVIAAASFLTDLYKLFIECESDSLTLEAYVYNLLYEVPAPPIGRCLSFTCVKKEIICYKPSMDELPLFEYSLQEFFTLLSIDVVLQLITCVLLENQIILLSSDYYRLMVVAESISNLIFPFFWQYVYVPILPQSLNEYLDAPIPFIMGIQRSSDDTENLRLPNEANLCLVDIDSDAIEVTEDLPQIPYKNEIFQDLVHLLNRWNVVSYCHAKRAENDKSESKLQKWRKSSLNPEKNLMSERSPFHSSKVGRTKGSYDWLYGGNARASSIPKSKGNWMKGPNYGILDLSINNDIRNDTGSIFNVKKNGINWIKEELQFNNAAREIFLNLFVQIFSNYESYVNVPFLQENEMEQWLATREAMSNFDKTSFLIEQPESHLPFLSRFIESQLFTCYVDLKIINGDKSVNVALFDQKIRLLRNKHDDSAIFAATYDSCVVIPDSENILNNRLTHYDIKIPPPQAIDPQEESLTVFNPGHFPLLDKTALNKEPPKNRRRGARGMQRRERQAQHLEQGGFSPQREKILQEARKLALTHPKIDMSSAFMANTNWKFVEQLLKECKNRTKRMLVQKMGSEAVELGHGECSLIGVEENTLIASLCELLERIWGHGLQRKHGKSALWSYLLNYQESFIEQPTEIPSATTNFLSPAVAWVIIRKRIENLSTKVIESDVGMMPSDQINSKHGTTRSRSVDRYSDRSTDNRIPKNDYGAFAFHSLPSSVIYDMKNILALAGINTQIGYSRAWVRLSLEKKLLSKHLQEILSKSELLRGLYKRYAFLRCEEEKVQFLSYLLSLNAVDFFCFTNKYHSAILPYRVIIFSSRKLSAASTTANAWVSLGGSLGHTATIPVPKNQNDVIFQHKNLGLLTTLRIGHDNSGISPKWLIEHVLVRNEVTGHTWKFPCGRWLGRGIDDGSLERVLVGEIVPWTVSSEDLVETCRTPPRCKSPNIAVPRGCDAKLHPSQIQQLLGDAVNNIVKFYYKPEKDKSNLTLLLCGDLGLVYCLELVFSYGFKNTRLFGKNLYIWDFFDRVGQQFGTVLREEEERLKLSGLSSDDQSHGFAVMRCFLRLVIKINNSFLQLGKDDKFQLFICLAARDHLLHRLLLPLQRCGITSQMYEETAFIRDPICIKDLINVLSALSEFEFSLEKTLTRGIDN